MRGLNSTKWMAPESSGDAPFYRYGYEEISGTEDAKLLSHGLIELHHIMIKFPLTVERDFDQVRQLDLKLCRRGAHDSQVTPALFPCFS